MSWWRLNRWWLLALPFALVGLAAASASNVTTFWLEEGLKKQLASASTGEWVEVTDDYEDAYGWTSRTLRIRLVSTGTAPTFPGADGPTVPPDGLEARWVRLELEASPDETIHYCQVQVEDTEGRRYDVPDASGQATPCLPDDRSGPRPPINRDQERGVTPEDEPRRPPEWSATPVFLLPTDAEISRVLVWWDEPDYVDLRLD